MTLTCKQLTPRETAGYGEVRWDADVTRQDGESVARYDVLTLVAKKESMTTTRRRLGDAPPADTARPGGADVGRRAARAAAGASAVDAAPRLRERAALPRERSTRHGVHPDDCRELADLAKFPTTTKADLRDNYPFGMFAVPQEQVRRIHASSGTTGQPTVVGYTANDIDTWATV